MTPERCCMCGAPDCWSCGPAQGYDPAYERYRESDAWEEAIERAYANGAENEEDAEDVVYQQWKEDRL